VFKKILRKWYWNITYFFFSLLVTASVSIKLFGMKESIFSEVELDWLKRHPAIEESINESIEDSLNTNPLDNGW
jgi:hypothetical protein